MRLSIQSRNYYHISGNRSLTVAARKMREPEFGPLSWRRREINRAATVRERLPASTLPNFEAVY
jgi:hypothetical protein